MAEPGVTRKRGIELPFKLVLCMLVILILGPAVSAFAYAAYPHSANPAAGSPVLAGSPAAKVAQPEAVALSVPTGFVPTKNLVRTLPVYTGSASRNPIGFNLNDGYCFYGSGLCGQLTSHGGVVMHNASIVIVLWAGCGSKGCLSCNTGLFDNSSIDPGASKPNDCAYGNLQASYFEDLCTAGNPLLRIINEYADGNGNLHSCSVYNGTWYYAYNKFPESPLTDADIQTEAIGVLNGMSISASTNTAVFVFTPYGISSCAAANDCFPTGSFCAYHSWFWSGTPYSSAQVVYANMPDDGWAGGNCGLGGPSPNHDPFADAEVSPLSHEADEMFTDPTPGYIFGDGWYHDGYLEIGDECAYDFVGTQPSDGSNVHLGAPGTVGQPYRIQSEWSNVNGGCTLDLKGPPVLFQETIHPDVSTRTVASPQNFTIHYQEAGETGNYSSMKSNCCGVATNFYATLGTYSSTDPVLNSTERWCFDASCNTESTYVAGPTFLGFYYFDLLQQATSFRVVGGGSVPPPTLAYQAAPASTTQGDHTVASTLLLNGSSQGFWTLRGSTITVPTVLAGGVTERWITLSSLWEANSAYAIPSLLTYYHEYSLTFSWSVVNGGKPGIPVLAFTQLGFHQELFLGPIPAPYWVDSGSAYNVTSSLPGSTSGERWIARSTSGTANISTAVAIDYYHQYYIRSSYSVVDGGSPAAPSLQVETLGETASYQMSKAPTSMWVDANSWSLSPVLGNSSSQRWATPGATNGMISSNSSISPVYYNQFRFVVGYLVSDSSAVAAPTLVSQSFGMSSNLTLGKSPVTYWLDNGGTWSVDHLLNGSAALERWITNSLTNGVVSAPLAESFEYLHEYYATIQSPQTGGGSLTPTAWYNATTSLQLFADPNVGWAFEGWTGSGSGAYSGALSNPTITVVAPIRENATFYPGLVLIDSGAGQVSYRWGTNQGTLESDVPIFVPVDTNVTLTASPASAFFVSNGYTGAGSSGKATASVLVDGPVTVTADFGVNYALLGALFGSIMIGGVALIYYLRRKRPN